MASELLLTGSLVYNDSESDPLPLQILDLVASVATKKVTRMKISVGFAAEEAITLGECTAPGWSIFINRDATNFIELRVSTGGAKFAKLKAGEFAMLRLGSGAQAPYAIADTAACQMDYLICQT